MTCGVEAENDPHQQGDFLGLTYNYASGEITLGEKHCRSYGPCALSSRWIRRRLRRATWLLQHRVSRSALPDR